MVVDKDKVDFLKLNKLIDGENVNSQMYMMLILLERWHAAQSAKCCEHHIKFKLAMMQDGDDNLFLMCKNSSMGKSIISFTEFLMNEVGDEHG